MSGGLKMLSGSDMSPSKDNLIISSLEDVHIASDEVNMEISVEINGGGGGSITKNSGDNKENHRQHHHHQQHAKSTNKDKMGGMLHKEQMAPRPVADDDISVTQQKNLINNGSLRHKEHHQQKKSKQQQYNAFLASQPQMLKGNGRDEKLHMDNGDDPVAIISHEVITGPIGNVHDGPMVVEVDPAEDEPERRGCCESVSK